GFGSGLDVRANSSLHRARPSKGYSPGLALAPDEKNAAQGRGQAGGNDAADHRWGSAFLWPAGADAWVLHELLGDVRRADHRPTWVRQGPQAAPVRDRGCRRVLRGE